MSIKELLNDPEFTEKLADTRTDGEVIEVFSQYGVTITKFDLDAAVGLCTDDSELNELTLDAVSGGFGYGEIIGGLISLGDALGTWKWWADRLGVNKSSGTVGGGGCR